MLRGYGMTFTIGRGTEVVVAAVAALSPLVDGPPSGRPRRRPARVLALAGRRIPAALDRPREGRDPPRHGGGGQRGVGPVGPGRGQAGVEARGRHDPAQLVDCVDFRTMTDALTPGGPWSCCAERERGRAERGGARSAPPESPPTRRRRVGSGTATRRSRARCRAAVADGWTHMKMKVGAAPEEDARRAAMIRERDRTRATS